MKKMLVILMAGLLVLMSGCGFLEGADGISANAVPGGTINFNESGLSSASTVVVVFDPDAYLLDGDETILTIPLSGYLILDAAVFTTTWYAPEVLPGDYYVYYWIDIDGDGVIDAAEESSLDLFDLTSSKTFDPPGAVTIIKSNNGVLFPNYTVWEDYAPQLNFEMGSGGW